MNANLPPPPWTIPASDPLEGGYESWYPVVERMLKVGQVWAMPISSTGYTKTSWISFEIVEIVRDIVRGTLRSCDGHALREQNLVRWERPHMTSFHFFAGHLINQERRPVLLWSPEEDETIARARVLEVD